MRDDFHAALDALLAALLEMSEVSDEMLRDALSALAAHDADAAADVIRRDAVVDELYQDNQAGLLRALALQAPVAGDLRLVAAMLHVNIHLERMGDYATSVARMVARSADLRDDSELAQQLLEMGEHARRVGREAMRSFTHRDEGLARSLPELDDRVDQLNRAIFHRLVRLASTEEAKLEWAESMLVVPRLLERYGDHGVDIGEQTIFVVTGTAVELSSNAPSNP